MGFIGFAFAAVLIGLGVAAGRWLASRAFGIRGFRKATNTEAERGRPALAFARALAGIAGVYLACAVLFMLALSSGSTPHVDEESMRVTVARGGPASEAGIVNGDRIASVNGEAPVNWDHLKKLVGAHPNEEISVDVERAGEKKSFKVTTVSGKILVGPFIEQRQLSGGALVAESFSQPFVVAKMFFKGFARMVSGSEKPELSGPVGVSREMDAAAKDGASPFLRLLAAIASYQAVFVDFALLVVALVMSLLPRRNSVLPTSGDSS